MPSQTGYYDTLKSVAGKVFTYLASITLTGTDGKTITVTQDTSLNEAVAMSSKAPKASPTFTGNVYGTSAGGAFTAKDPTNSAVYHSGGPGSDNVALQDNNSFTITMSATCGLFSITKQVNGYGALFFTSYASATIISLADPSSAWEVTDSDTGKLAIFKSAASQVVTIKNYTNAVAYITVNVVGCVLSTTAPA